MIGEIGDGGFREFAWPVICIILGLDWLRQPLISPSRVVFHPGITLVYLLILVAWVLSLVGSIPTATLVSPDQKAIIDQRVTEAFLTSTIILASMTAAADPRRLELFFRIVVVSAIPYAITTFFMGAEIEEWGEVVRRAGIFVDVGPASTYMIFAMILAVVFIRRGEHALFYSGCIFLFLATMVPTNSKTAMIVIAMLLVIDPIIDGKWKQAGATAVIGPLVVLALVPLLPSTIYNSLVQAMTSLFIDPYAAVAGQGGTFAERIKHFWMGLDLASQYPLFGFGLMKHIAVLPVLHVTYIAVLAETGIVGFSLYLAMIIVVLRTGFRALKAFSRSGDRQSYLAMKALLLSFIATLIIMTTQPWHGQEDRLFWLLAGWIGGMEYWRCRSRAAREQLAGQADPVPEDGT
ncbi:MAG TPA: hypothetical protein ENK49_09770 [Gammaproteobacteria bacterium]|nr:hypothetical protein [Gammaproteobacteria bacterium]